MSNRILWLVGLFLLALVLRLMLAANWYTEDLHRFESGDYALYRIGAEHLMTQGDLTNSLFLVRPPLFPAFIALAGNNPLTVLVLNAFIGALMAPLTVLLAQQLALGPLMARTAGIIVALDPASIVYSSFLGPEPVANLFILVAVILILLAMSTDRNRMGLLYAGGAGLALACSTAARPAAFLLWVPLSLWLGIAQRRRWMRLGLFSGISIAWVILWTAHNAAIFANPTYSTISTYNLLYYRAAAVERLASGDDIDTVYTRLSRTVEDRLGNTDAPVDSDWRFHLYTPSPEQQAVMLAVALDVFRAHPLEYVALIPVGLWNMFGETGPLTGLWHILDIGWNSALLLGTFAGIILAGRRRAWLLFWCVVICGVYFTAGTIFVQTSGMDARMRTMLTPWMAASTAYFLGLLGNRFLKAPGSGLG